MRTENVQSHDSKMLYVSFWEEVTPFVAAKGVIQLVHGMAEHMFRYDGFARFMNAAGWIVVGDDHRAHGNTDPETLGKAYGADLFWDSVADEKMLTALLKKRYHLPVVLIGHSYGSFLTQAYLTQGAEGISGVVLSGSAAMEGISVNLGYGIAKRRCKKGKANEVGHLFVKNTFEKYDKKMKEGKNGWLSRDVVEVGKYNTDPLCNFDCSNGFYQSFFGGLKNIAADTGEKIPKNLKMLIASGNHDGVGGYGKLVQKLYNRYISFGINPQLKLYHGARHELTNETNRNEVFRDFLAFANACLV